MGAVVGGLEDDRCDEDKTEDLGDEVPVSHTVDKVHFT